MVWVEDVGFGLLCCYYNFVYVFDSEGQIVFVVDKVYLVFFGEYMFFVGFLWFWGIDMIVVLLGGYSVVVSFNFLIFLGGCQLYFFICYEVIFLEEIGFQVVCVLVLINFINDIWFGRIFGFYQYFYQVQVIVVEFGLLMICSVNSGIFVIIVVNGQIILGVIIYIFGVVDLIFVLKFVLLLNSFV